MLITPFPKPDKRTVEVHLVSPRRLRSWSKQRSATAQRWLKAADFHATPGTHCLLPARSGELAAVVAGVDETPTPWSFAWLPSALPKGRYAVALQPDHEPDDVALGLTLGTYAFDRYKKFRAPRARFAWPEGANRERVTLLAEATELGRDLINTPASDLGPAELADACADVARRHQAELRVISGPELVVEGYPAIFAVGTASHRQPRLIDMSWGPSSAPAVTLVGKGVCFDSGGLDLKPASSMLLMKKDMGGAATVLALAHALMAAKLPLRLRVLIPAVDNAIGPEAMRPLDVLRTRSGKTVEVGNTDAEGRLVLCDALTEASASSPALVIDVATLTGAARVALGTSLPALFCNDDAVAETIRGAGTDVHDPLWSLPLHAPYQRSLDSTVADLSNVGRDGYGGAITAALFLEHFIQPSSTRWAHVDTMAWALESTPGRPAGGEVFGLRALFAAIERLFAAPQRRATP